MNIRYLLVILFAALLIAGVYAAIPANEPQQPSNPRYTVYVVNVHGAGGEVIGGGSGVMIDELTMLTAAHVVAHDMKITVGEDQRPAKVLRLSEKHDVALLQVALGCPCADVGVLTATQDVPVIAVGYPLGKIIGNTQVLTEGRLQGEFKIAGVSRLLMSAPVAPGNSGGAVFAKGSRGDYVLVGLSVGVAAVPMGFSASIITHLAVAVPSETIVAFLNGTLDRLTAFEAE